MPTLCMSCLPGPPSKEDAMRIDREEKAARAEALFREGYNCAQSVVLAYVQEMGLEMQTAARPAKLRPSRTARNTAR